ncbi:hypothetical protein GCM10020256_21860 [Streptomyces thermocoprophilus]
MPGRPCTAGGCFFCAGAGRAALVVWTVCRSLVSVPQAARAAAASRAVPVSRAREGRMVGIS